MAFILGMVVGAVLSYLAAKNKEQIIRFVEEVVHRFKS